MIDLKLSIEVALRFVLLALLCATLASSAYASGQAFPPAGCASDTPFMSFTGTGDTYCSNGQQVFTSAIPTCQANQVVAYDGTKFYCKTEANVPTCNPNEFLSFDGQTYQCKGSGVATCGDNQVLTFNGTSYFCVNKDASIPVCGANQFLTYNGSYQCAAVDTPSIPNCGAGQVVMGNGAQLYCAAAPQPTLPVCGAGQVVTSNGSQLYCVNDNTAGAPCGTLQSSWTGSAVLLHPVSVWGIPDSAYYPGPAYPSGKSVFATSEGIIAPNSVSISGGGDSFTLYSGYPMYSCVDGSWQ